MKRTIHFIYVAPGANKAGRAWNKLSRATHGLMPPLHQWLNYSYLQWPQPVHAPYSISYNVLKYFDARGHNIKFYDWKDRGSIRLEEDDILIGHPACHMDLDPYRVDTESILFQTLKNNQNHPRAYFIGPYNHSERQVGWFREYFKIKPDLQAIFVCGKNWIESWQESPLKDVLPREQIFQMNMCVDLDSLPLVKTSFNPPGKRRFLYIGRCSPEKNISLLEALARALPDFEGGYISIGQIDGWKKIADFAHLTPEYAAQLAQSYDIFINASTYDSQATTVLEQMALGLAIACTPESGTSYDSIYEIQKDDVTQTLRILQQLQQEDSSVLIQNAQKNRDYVKTNHNWSDFLNKLEQHILE